ncbi:MAG: TlpA family protein disulfide reductase [Bacteroidia bacterium]|nr:TlpA family protein disulfide reductase [Bacteroidia bacterium]
MKLSIILFFILLIEFSSAQDDFIKCWQNAFKNMDSTGLDIEGWRNCVKGKHIPDFKSQTVLGKTINSKNLQGKVIVLNFWFIDCLPCIAELPALNMLVNDFKDQNVEFLAFTHDTKKRLDTAFFIKYKFDFNIFPGDSTVIKQFGEMGYPNTYIIDKSGKVKEVFIGGFADEQVTTNVYLKAKPIIDELLKAE